MFRLVIKEKLLLVMTRLQSLLASQWKNVSPLPIPDMLHLNNMASDVVASLNLADKLTSRYETARLMLGLKLKMGEAGVIHLIGVGYRCWDDPTLPGHVYRHAIQGIPVGLRPCLIIWDYARKILSNVRDSAS